jgi:colanic acid biosynthesis glycosyl transferase WcaI
VSGVEQAPGRRRVAFLNRFYHPDHSATSQVLHDLTRGLAAEGYDILVVTSRLLYGDRRRSLPPDEAFEEIEVHRVWTTAFGRKGAGRALDYLTFYFAAAWKLARATRRGDVVVAMTDPPMLGAAIGWVVRLRRGRLVNWLQDLFPEVIERVSGRAWLPALLAPVRALRDASLRAAALNVAIGGRMEAYVVRVARARTTVIPNWADGREIVPLPKESHRLREEWGLREKFVVGYSGNLGRVHELDTIVQAAERLVRHPRIVFLFIGDGHQRARLEASCVGRALDNVIFKPYLPRSMIGLGLTVADVHLVSLQPAMEGLVVPSKIYGAMAAGVPVLFIGDPSGEVAEILSGLPPVGRVITSGDSQGLAHAIVDLEASPAAVAEMGLAARERLLADYDVRIAVSRWSALLKSVATGDAHEAETSWNR